MLTIKKTDAIVIKKSFFGNTSEIITFYTKDYGKISTVAKGIHRKRSPFEGYAELLSFNEILFIDGEGRRLSTLTESTQKMNFPEIRKNIKKIYWAFFLAEFIDQMVEERDVSRELFDLFLKSLVDLDKNNDILICCAAFAAKGLTLLGFMPAIKKCCNCDKEFASDEETQIHLKGEGLLCNKCGGGVSEELKFSASSRASLDKILDWKGQKLYRLRLSRTNIKEIWRFLKGIINVTIDRELRTLKYAEAN